MDELYDIDAADYPCPVKVGDKIVVGDMVCIRNDVGGTEMIREPGTWNVEVLKSFWDYECGWRFHGRLLDADSVEFARKEGTTGYTPEDYKYPNNPEAYERAKEAHENFDPSYCFFSEFDIKK